MPVRRHGSSREPGSGADIAARAAAEVDEPLDAGALEAFAEALVAVAVGSPRTLARRVVDQCEATGRRAALDGVSLPALVDGFLSVSRIVWVEHVQATPTDSRGTPRTVSTGEGIFRAADTALAAVARGFGAARRALVREEESERRELIDDLLLGTPDTAAAVSRAERFGLHMTAPHTVVVAATETGSRNDPARMADLESRLRVVLPHRDLLVATKDRHLVLIIGERGDSDTALAESDRLLKAILIVLRRRLHGDGSVQLSVGPALQGPTGVAASYRAARQGSDISARLGWTDPIVRPSRLAVYDVLLRDRHALTVLVRSVLTPLSEARGGAEPLLATLVSYLASGGVATETARRMNLSVRAVTYRLARIKTLTGWDPADPRHRLTLLTAAEGARLLGWPAEPL